MKQRVKWWSVSLVLVAALIALAGCGSGASGSEGKTGEGGAAQQVELEFWTINLKKNFESYITGLIDEYQKSHPNVKINWVDVPGAEVDKKLITALSSDNVPDVVNETTQGLSVLQGYNAIYPLSDLVDKNAFQPYIKGLMDSVTRDGKVMALPWYNGGPPVQFVNAELYEKAGLDPNKPAKTYDELFAYGKQIHAKLPEVYGSNDLPTIEVMISEGLPIVSPDRKKAVFNSPDHVALVQKFIQAYKDGAIAPGAIVKDDRQLQQTIENEQTAHSGQAFSTGINTWEKNAPNVIPKLRVYPAVVGKANKLAIKDFQLFIVPKKSKHPKEAADFALFVTSPQKQLEFCKIVNIFPSTEETLKDPFFTDIKGDTLKDQARKVMVASADKLTLGSFGFDKELEMVDNYMENIRAAFLGQKTVQQALDDAVNFWNSMLAKQ